MFQIVMADRPLLTLSQLKRRRSVYVGGEFLNSFPIGISDSFRMNVDGYSFMRLMFVVLTVWSIYSWKAASASLSFHEGVKADRTQAVHVNILEWPEQSFDFEGYFEEAPELPFEYAPAPVATNAAIPSVLTPTTRNLTLLEIRRRREGKL